MLFCFASQYERNSHASGLADVGWRRLTSGAADLRALIGHAA